MADINQEHLNGHSGLILAVFCMVSFFVIFPIQIPLLGFLQRPLLKALVRCRIIGEPERKVLSEQRLHFTLSLLTAPLIGVLLLLATTTINGSTIRLGIVGDENVKPYEVLVLFISLAYISIALDGTGALEAIAFWVSKQGGSSGRLLFFYLYAFFFLVGCIVGNDPLILSGTPFLAYLTSSTGLEPTAWIFSEFMAANTASAVLVSSNPTNILIAGSFNLNFLTGFTKWTILPTIIPAVLNYPIVYAMFHKRIPKKLTPLTEDPWVKLRDRTGAIFLSVLMVVTVVVLVGTSFVPGHAVEVWMVTAPAGILAFTFNLLRDSLYQKTLERYRDTQKNDAAAEMQPVARHDSRTSSNYPTRRQLSRTASSHNSIANDSRKPPSSTAPATEKADTANQQPSTQDEETLHDVPKTPGTLTHLLSSMTYRFPSTTLTLHRLPIPLLPFAMCEFILVRGLSQRGWVRVFAIGFARACAPSPLAAIMFMAFISAAFLCPLAGTNIGATILLVEVLRSPQFMESEAVLRDPRVLWGSVYAVAMGSNLGAFSYTFAGSLAGLLWRGLLSDKGVVVSARKFAMVNFIPLVMQTTVAGLVIWGEVYWFTPPDSI
ncbi:uncharacterized protein AB675_4090 [Cyphellophora attinorum]|uniref:Citrate transporter-like domain-containing protein n=1 Tax=Cyphellophora attinorum TaxID=1664694 RepID=A0A0N0NKS9_9EURO|nr:uncharacterized protein AB675_4090 [Phialophora attinorum]KPI38501.1 hypothetical protein AB675_4090 [Phialophora attinorum]